MSDIAERTRALVTEHLGCARAEVIDTAELREDLGADSLDDVELAMAIEEEFGFEVTDDDTDAWKTVGDVVRLVEKRVQ